MDLPFCLPAHTGLGTRLIKRNLAAEFKGKVELEYHPDGLECVICAPAGRLGLAKSQVD